MVRWLIVLTLILPVYAEARVISLEQALAVAMEKNRDIEKAREYAGYVRGRYVEERAAALPQLTLSGSLQMAKDESLKVTGAPAQRQTGQSLDLGVSQPLYTWGKLGAAIRAAEVGLKTADEQLRLYRQAAYRDVVAAYLDIQLAQELSRLARQNRDQKERHLEEAKRKFSAGVATDYDVLAAEVTLENTATDVIRADNSVRLASERLRFLLAVGGEELETSGSLEDVDTLALPGSYEEALRTAGTRRPELVDLRLRVGIYQELVTIASADDKPRLDLRGGVGWHRAEVDDPGPARDASGAAWNVGVYATFPFFDGLRTSGRVAQARSDLSSKRIEEAKLLDAIALEVRQAELSCREAAEIVKALSGTVKQAERLVQMAEKGYEFGVKIRLEVDDAQLNLLQARSNLARAKRDLRVARVNYLWAVGMAGE